MNELENVVEVTPQTKESLTAAIVAKKEYLEQTAVLGAISIGQDLKQLKELVDHGEWYSYIESNVGFSKRKVQNLMLFADKYGTEGTAFNELISKTHANSHLSYSNALALLSVDENEVENFVEEIEEDSSLTEITVKELKEKIKEHQKEKEEVKEKLETQNQILERTKKELNELAEEQKRKEDESEERIQNLMQEKEKLENEINSNTENETLELTKDQKEEIRELESKLEKETEKVKELKEKAKAAKEATDIAYEKARSELSEKLESLISENKKLEASSDDRLIKFKLLTENIQKTLIEIDEVINDIRTEDEEKANKMKTAIKTVIGKQFE